MYYYVSAWNKFRNIADIFTASWEFLCMAGSSFPTSLGLREVPVCGNWLCEVKAHSQRLGNALNIVLKIWVSVKQVSKLISFGWARVLCYFTIHFSKIVWRKDFPLLSTSGWSKCHLVLSITQSILLSWDFCVCSSEWILVASVFPEGTGNEGWFLRKV